MDSSKTKGTIKEHKHVCGGVYVCAQTYPGSRMQVKTLYQNSNSDSL